MPLLVLALLIIAFLFWLRQLKNIIAMDDVEFKGRNDKLIFFIIVFFGSLPGAIGIYFWLRCRRKKMEDEQKLEARIAEALAKEGVKPARQNKKA